MCVADMQAIIFLLMKENENTLIYLIGLFFSGGQMIHIYFLRIKKPEVWISVSALFGKHGIKPRGDRESWEMFHSNMPGSDE